MYNNNNTMKVEVIVLSPQRFDLFVTCSCNCRASTKEPVKTSSQVNRSTSQIQVSEFDLLILILICIRFKWEMCCTINYCWIVLNFRGLISSATFQSLTADISLFVFTSSRGCGPSSNRHFRSSWFGPHWTD